MILADQIKDLEQRSGALERCLNIEQKRIDLLNEEEKTQVPDFWDNPDQAREQLRRVAAIKAWVDDYDAVAKDVEDLALMPEFVKEGVVSEQEMDAHYAQTLERIEKLEMRNMLGVSHTLARRSIASFPGCFRAKVHARCEHGAGRRNGFSFDAGSAGRRTSPAAR